MSTFLEDKAKEREALLRKYSDSRLVESMIDEIWEGLKEGVIKP